MPTAYMTDYATIYCPHCGDFFGNITDNFFWGDEEQEREVFCRAENCGLPFIIKRE